MEQANYRLLSASDCMCSVQGFKFSMDKIMFLLISMFVRMVQPNTESTTNISSTLRFKVLVAVSR